MMLACGQRSMEFYPSVDDPEKYTRIIEPWFLNSLNKMSDNNTWMKVKKIEVFDKATKVNLVGYKGNKEELEKYSEYNNFLLEKSDANIFEDSGLPKKEPPVVFTVVTTSCYYFYCTRSTGVFILLIIFLASLNRDLSQESRCEVVITTKS
jgi:hypothetical protein